MRAYSFIIALKSKPGSIIPRKYSPAKPGSFGRTSRPSSSIHAFEGPIAEISGLSRAVGEVDDHLHPLRRRDAEALHRHRAREQAAVGGDRDERLPVAERELEEARVRAVQEPEAILAPRHLEERLDDAVHDELVAEEPVVVEGVVDEEAVPVELPVLDDEPDVELPARQPQGRRGVQLVPGVEEVGVEEEPGEPAVDVRAGDV